MQNCDDDSNELRADVRINGGNVQNNACNSYTQNTFQKLVILSILFLMHSKDIAAEFTQYQSIPCTQ